MDVTWFIWFISGYLIGILITSLINVNSYKGDQLNVIKSAAITVGILVYIVILSTAIFITPYGTYQ